MASGVTGTRFPRVRGHSPLEVCKCPWSLRGSREYAPHGYMGLMAGLAACCTLYIRHFPLVPVQRWSTELPATTVGERRRRRSLRRHKGGLWTVFLTSCHKCCCSVAFKCQAYEGQTVSGQSHIWRSRCGKSAIWRFQAACHVLTRPCPCGRSDAAVAAGWQFHPVTRAHGCKEQQSGVTTQVSRAPPARATNPRTGGHRPKKRPLTTGIPVGHFLTWQASSSMPHWCPTWCRRTWYVGLWSTTASTSRCSRSWYFHGGGLHGIVIFLVLRSFHISLFFVSSARVLAWS